ncbi:hypothetical protein NKH77_40050 [Streptomyces sp. M19]
MSTRGGQEGELGWLGRRQADDARRPVSPRSCWPGCRSGRCSSPARPRTARST